MYIIPPPWSSHWSPQPLKPVDNYSVSDNCIKHYSLFEFSHFECKTVVILTMLKLGPSQLFRY